MKQFLNHFKPYFSSKDSNPSLTNKGTSTKAIKDQPTTNQKDHLNLNQPKLQDPANHKSEHDILLSPIYLPEK
jgi:hypothetical protein